MALREDIQTDDGLNPDPSDSMAGTQMGGAVRSAVESSGGGAVEGGESVAPVSRFRS